MPEWFEGLDAEHLEHATAKGWNKPLTPEIATEIVKAHRSAQSVIGSDPTMIVKLPKDATDPSYQGIYDRVVGMSAPKGPEDYKFDGIVFKDGSPLDADDQAFVRDIAVKHKLPVAVARTLASELAARADTAFEAANGNSAAAKGANEAALRGTWSSEYDQKSFSASKAADGLKALGLHVSDGAGMSSQEYVAHMNGLVTLSAQLGEAAILRGGHTPSDPTHGMTPDAAQARFDELKQDPAWATKALTPGTEENKLFGNLQRLIARGRVAA